MDFLHIRTLGSQITGTFAVTSVTSRLWLT